MAARARAQKTLEVSSGRSSTTVAPQPPAVAGASPNDTTPGSDASARRTAQAMATSSSGAEILAYVGCVAGAVLLDETIAQLRAAGFTDIAVEPKPGASILDDVQDPLYRLVRDKLPENTGPEDYVVSVNVRAVRPL